MAVPSSLRILSYNVRYFGHATRGLASTRTSMRRIAERARRARPAARPSSACRRSRPARSARTSPTASHPEETQLERFMDELSTALGAAGAQADQLRRVLLPGPHLPARRTHPRLHDRASRCSRTPTSPSTTTTPRRPHDITHRRCTRSESLKQTRICAHVRFTPRRAASDLRRLQHPPLACPATFSREFWTERAAHGLRPQPARGGAATSPLRRARARSDALRRRRRLQLAPRLAGLPLPARARRASSTRSPRPTATVDRGPAR